MEGAQIFELLVQCRNWNGIRKGVTASFAAPSDCLLQIRTKDNIVQDRSDISECIQKPGPNDAIHQDEVASLRIAGSSPGQHVDHYCTLAVGLGMPWWNQTCFDEMPEVVRMQVDLRAAGQLRDAVRGGRFA